MKSCLKCSVKDSCSFTPGPVPGPSSSASPFKTRPKCAHRVSFRDKCEYEVHTADEWDRTPVDVAAKLSYEDILELKEMQLAAAKACARATAASGMTPKYLSNVPLGLLPLLPPETNAAATTSPPTSPCSFSPPPQPNILGMLANSSGNGADTSSAGLSLAEVCLCRVFSADTGLPATTELGHHQAYEQDQTYSGGSSSGVSSPIQTARPDGSRQSTGQPQFRLVSGVHQIPSPPDTPPRMSVTSIPPPPPTRKARQFAFLPLLDASSSSPSMSMTPSPNASSPSSPRLGASVPPVSLSASLSALCPKMTSPPSSSYSSFSSSTSSSSSSTPSPGAYAAYDPYGGAIGVGGNATLGLERRLGFKFESDSDSQSTSSSEEEEDNGWPRDWPGRRPHAHTQRPNSHSHSHSHSIHDPHSHRYGDAKGDSSNSDQRLPSRRLPPSPPFESNRPLPSTIPPLTTSFISPSVSPTRNSSSSPRGSSSPQTSSPSRRSSESPSSSTSSVRKLHTSSPSPPPQSSPRMRKNKMALPLVTLA